MDKCMIGEFVGEDPMLSEVVMHINRECSRRNCPIRAEADVGIANHKMEGKTKIGQGSLTMFLHGVKGTFNCNAKLEGDKLIFFR